MTNLAIVAGRDTPAVSSAETRAAYDQVVASFAWYALHGGNEAKAREQAPAIAEHLPAAIRECEARLVPIATERLSTKLGRLLTACAGSGYTEDDRGEWLVVAISEFHRIPADLFDIAYKAALAKADHPSKIIPALLEASRTLWNARRAALGRARKLAEFTSGPGQAEQPRGDAIPPSEVPTANRLMRKLGLTTRYRPDGRPFQLQPGELDPAESAAPDSTERGAGQ